MEDSRILTLFSARDEQALRAVSEKYGGFCRGIAFGILGSRQDAEECFNDVLLKVWEAIPPACPENLPGYLAAVTRRRALNLLEQRNAKKRGGGITEVPLSEIDYSVAAPQTENPALRAAVNGFLAGLKQETRVIFVKYYCMDETAEDIAMAHGCSTARIKSLLHRTKRAFARYLKKEGLL